MKDEKAEITEEGILPTDDANTDMNDTPTDNRSRGGSTFRMIDDNDSMEESSSTARLRSNNIPSPVVPSLPTSRSFSDEDNSPRPYCRTTPLPKDKKRENQQLVSIADSLGEMVSIIKTESNTDPDNNNNSRLERLEQKFEVSDKKHDKKVCFHVFVYTHMN